MAIPSKYSTDRIEALLQQLFDNFEQDQSPVDLQLMVLGNAVTHIFNHEIAPARREALMESFASALRSSIRQDSAH